VLTPRSNEAPWRADHLAARPNPAAGWSVLDSLPSRLRGGRRRPDDRALTRESAAPGPSERAECVFATTDPASAADAGARVGAPRRAQPDEVGSRVTTRPPRWPRVWVSTKSQSCSCGCSGCGRSLLAFDRACRAMPWRPRSAYRLERQRALCHEGSRPRISGAFRDESG
jgi:hypothetical protein